MGVIKWAGCDLASVSWKTKQDALRYDDVGLLYGMCGLWCSKAEHGYNYKFPRNEEEECAGSEGGWSRDE